MIKQVAALGGDTVCRAGIEIKVNGARVAHARHADGVGRALPVWRGCVQLDADQVFLLGSHPESFDSRYFGLVNRASILGRAMKL
jgi:type IV secretory pathway protease TraF